MKSAAVELLVELIRNECVNDGTPDSGNEHRSVATLQDFFGRGGVVFEPHPGRQSVVYRVKGTSTGAPALMLMGHLDVVPAGEVGWRHPPFGGVIDDGYVWGRGAVDMLNVTAAMAAAFRPYLVGERPPPPGDLVYLGVADEEAGGFLGAQWLLDNDPGAVACDYILTEVAYPPVVTAAGPAYPVAVAEKGPYWRRLIANGEPGHGSQPLGRANAVVDLAKAIVRLAEAPTPVGITDEWRSVVEVIDPGPEIAEALLDPDRVDAAIEAIAASDPLMARIAHALTHLTVSPNVIDGGSKANVIAEDGVAEIDIRALPGQDETTVDDHLQKVLGSDLYDRLQIEPIMDYPAGSSPAAGPLWEALGDGYERVAGTRRRFPYLISGTTDARFFRSRGVTAYGAGMFDDRMSAGEFASIFHGHNERVSEDSVGLSAELYATTIERFGVHSTTDR